MKRWLLLILPAFAMVILFGLFSSPIIASPVEVTPLPPVENPDNRAGACYAFYHDPPGSTERPFLPLAYDAGSRWDRFDFIWPNLEPKDNEWDPAILDSYDTLTNDLQEAAINPIGILLWTPEWAASSGASGLPAPGSDRRPNNWYTPGQRPGMAPQAISASPSPPRGLYEAWDDWTTADGDPINYWGRFVYKTVDRYSDRGVKHWEMWNEPEWNFFWTGTSTDYAQLLKVGYQATKAACSDCKVLFGGLHYWANPSYYRWVLNILNDDPQAPQNNYFFDVMSVHLYSRSSSIYERVIEIRDGMTDFVPVHPIWLTETGVPVWNDESVDPDPTKYDFAATQDEAAAYMIQSYANAWAADVEKYLFFRTHDADMSEYFGLIRNDRTFRPSYVAYQVATTYMISPTMVTHQSDGNLRRVTLWGTPHGKLSVLWNNAPDAATLEYAAILPSATLVDRRGITQTITAEPSGTGTLQTQVYTLALPEATANLVSNVNDYFIGGEPYLVVEADTTPPTTATIEPLPTTIYSHTIALSCTADDDEAGVWGYELQLQEGSTRIEWPGIHPSPALFTEGQHDRTYCFSARAWDLAGNPGPWQGGDDLQTCTTLNWEREVHVTVGDVFGDENSNGIRESEEITLTDVVFRLVDATGADVVTPTAGSSWSFTATLLAGDYTLLVTPRKWPSQPPGWIPRRETISFEPGASVQEIDRPTIGLLPHRSSTFLPSVLHDAKSP